MLKICKVCGKEFEATQDKTMCCSKYCYTRMWRNNNPKKKVQKIGVCVICGKEYEQKKITQKCCGKECREIYDKQQRKILNDRHNEKRKAERKTKKKAEKPITNYERLKQLEIEALEHGMSYGKYVAKMGL